MNLQAEDIAKPDDPIPFWELLKDVTEKVTSKKASRRNATLTAIDDCGDCKNKTKEKPFLIDDPKYQCIILQESNLCSTVQIDQRISCDELKDSWTKNLFQDNIGSCFQGITKSYKDLLEMFTTAAAYAVDGKLKIDDSVNKGEKKDVNAREHINSKIAQAKNALGSYLATEITKTASDKKISTANASSFVFGNIFRLGLQQASKLLVDYGPVLGCYNDSERRKLQCQIMIEIIDPVRFSLILAGTSYGAYKLSNVLVGKLTKNTKALSKIFKVLPEDVNKVAKANKGIIKSGTLRQKNINKKAILLQSKAKQLKDISSRVKSPELKLLSEPKNDMKFTDLELDNFLAKNDAIPFFHRVADKKNKGSNKLYDSMKENKDIVKDLNTTDGKQASPFSLFVKNFPDNQDEHENLAKIIKVLGEKKQKKQITRTQYDKFIAETKKAMSSEKCDL